MRLIIARHSKVCVVARSPSVYSLCGCSLPVSLQFVQLPVARQSTVCAVRCPLVYSLCGHLLSVSLQFVRSPVVRQSTVCAVTCCPTVYSLCGHLCLLLVPLSFICFSEDYKETFYIMYRYEPTNMRAYMCRGSSAQ